MKKFVIILFAVILSSISLAHIGHYNKFDKIEMEILRNDELIGYNNYLFERSGEKTIVKNQLLAWKKNDAKKLITEINNIELLIKKNSTNSVNIISDFILNTSNKFNN